MLFTTAYLGFGVNLVFASTGEDGGKNNLL